jgi:pyrimidine-nucleoside phosphorylase
MNAQLIGEASAILGAGRQKKGDAIDYGAGIVLKKKTGDFARAGEPIAVLYTNNPAAVGESERVFLSALCWQERTPEKQPLILGVVQ